MPLLRHAPILRHIYAMTNDDDACAVTDYVSARYCDTRVMLLPSADAMPPPLSPRHHAAATPRRRPRFFHAAMPRCRLLLMIFHAAQMPHLRFSVTIDAPPRRRCPPRPPPPCQQAHARYDTIHALRTACCARKRCRHAVSSTRHARQRATEIRRVRQPSLFRKPPLSAATRRLRHDLRASHRRSLPPAR